MKSLGYIECNGLSGAIVAADRMLRTTDVDLSSIQNTEGNGWVTLQVSDELSAVTVAIEAVRGYLPDIYVTSAVIGRPASGLDSLGKTDLLNQTPKKKEANKPVEPAITIQPESVKDSIGEKVDEHADEPSIEDRELANDSKTVDGPDDKDQDVSSNEKVTCNMCGNPKCPRKLGEPHKKYIHYNELKEK